MLADAEKQWELDSERTSQHYGGRHSCHICGDAGVVGRDMVAFTTWDAYSSITELWAHKICGLVELLRGKP